MSSKNIHDYSMLVSESRSAQNQLIDYKNTQQVQEVQVAQFGSLPDEINFHQASPILRANVKEELDTSQQDIIDGELEEQKDGSSSLNSNSESQNQGASSHGEYDELN